MSACINIFKCQEESMQHLCDDANSAGLFAGVWQLEKG